ncbi:hypothetical protein [Thermococcus sp. JCM 11816]
MSEYRFIKWFEELGKEDVPPLVGGKGANLVNSPRPEFRFRPDSV